MFLNLAALLTHQCVLIIMIRIESDSVDFLLWIVPKIIESYNLGYFSEKFPLSRVADEFILQLFVYVWSVLN